LPRPEDLPVILRSRPFAVAEGAEVAERGAEVSGPEAIAAAITGISAEPENAENEIARAIEDTMEQATVVSEADADAVTVPESDEDRSA
jgi:hypothetical protein